MTGAVVEEGWIDILIKNSASLFESMHDLQLEDISLLATLKFEFK